MSTFVILPSGVQAPTNTESVTYMTIDQLMYEAVGTNGLGNVTRCALTLQGAKQTSADTIVTKVDLNLGALFNMKTAKDQDSHASAPVTIRKSDVSVSTWTSLVSYAAACVGGEFRGGALQLVAGSGYQHFVPELGAESGIAFDLVDYGMTNLGQSYGLSGFYLRGDVTFGALLVSQKAIGIEKREDVFAGIFAPAAPAVSKPVGVKFAVNPLAAAHHPMAR